MQSNKDVLQHKNRVASSLTASMGISSHINTIDFKYLPELIEGGVNAMFSLLQFTIENKEDLMNKKDFPQNDLFLILHVINKTLFLGENYDVKDSSLPGVTMTTLLMDLIPTDDNGGIIKDIYHPNVQNLHPEQFQMVDSAVYAVYWTVLEIIAANVYMAAPDTKFLNQYDENLNRIVTWFNTYHYEKPHVVVKQLGTYSLVPIDTLH